MALYLHTYCVASHQTTGELSGRSQRRKTPEEAWVDSLEALYRNGMAGSSLGRAQRKKKLWRLATAASRDESPLEGLPLSKKKILNPNFRPRWATHPFLSSFNTTSDISPLFLLFHIYPSLLIFIILLSQWVSPTLSPTLALPSPTTSSPPEATSLGK